MTGGLSIAGLSGVAVALLVGAAFIWTGSPWWGAFFVAVGIIIAILTGKS